MRRFTVGAAVLVGVLALSGCGVDAGAAAVVDGRRISVAEVQQATEQVNRIVSADGRFTQRVSLSYLIVEPYLVAEAAEAGVGVTQDQAVRIFSQFRYKDPRTGSTTPSDAAVALVRAVLAVNVLQGSTLTDGATPLPAAQGEAAMQQVVADLQAADITVNPRYGSFEPVFDLQAQRIFPITPSQEDWLVPAAPPVAEQPAPQPSP